MGTCIGDIEITTQQKGYDGTTFTLSLAHLLGSLVQSMTIWNMESHNVL